jgi:hypothetical protein
MCTGRFQRSAFPHWPALLGAATLLLHATYCEAAVPICDSRLGITDRKYRGVYTQNACTDGTDELYAYAHFTIASDGHVAGMRTEFVEPYISNLPRNMALQNCIKKMVNFVAVDIRLAPPKEICELSLPIYSSVLFYDFSRANLITPPIKPLGSGK